VRTLFLAGAFALAAAAGAAPPLTLLADRLDPDMPAAELPQRPVEDALADLKAMPRARVLVPLRRGTTATGERYALAAWRTDPAALGFDAIVVIDSARGARVLEASATAADPEPVLAALLAHAASAAPVAAATPPPVPAGPAPVQPYRAPESWDQRFVVLYAPVAGYRTGDAPAEMALTAAHQRYLEGLQDEGKALAAGPLAGPGPAVEMLLLRVRDLATARALAEADPVVVAGRYAVTVQVWTVPAGRL
jgi:uncharacterized protein YciI